MVSNNQDIKEHEGITHCDEVEEAKVPLLISLEDMIEQYIGRLNYTQVFQTFLASLSPMFDSFQTFMSIFAHAQPSWHCTNSSVMSSNTTASTCQSNKSDLCSLSKREWAWDFGNGTYTSIISEWDLECANSFVTSLPSTSYFVGSLLGGLVLATFGDSSLGRKNLLCLSSLVMSLAALACGFAPNIWVYSILRFVCGVGRAPLAMCVLVLLTERVGKRWRSQALMVGFIFSSLGIMVLAGIAYLCRESSWRTTYLITSIPCVIFSILGLIVMHESPRWLLLQGRVQEAMDVFTSLGHPISKQNMPNNIIEYTQKNVTHNKGNSFFASFSVLISRGWAVKRLIASMLLSFGIGLIYFGMFLGVENLGSDIYQNSFLHASLSLFSFLLAFLVWIPSFKRRISLFGFCSFSGTTSIIITLIALCGGQHKGALITVMDLASMFSACMAYNIVTMYVAELFPTCVRSSASSLVRQALILGSVFDPVLIHFGSENMLYSYGVFGFAMLLCGFLVKVPWLPETKGKTFCDTLEEQELQDNE